MPKKSSRNRSKGKAGMAVKCTCQPKKTSVKSRMVMCRDFFWFGSASLVIGTLFFFLAFITAMTMVRFFVGAFFLILGIIDLTLYIFFRER